MIDPLCTIKGTDLKALGMFCFRLDAPEIFTLPLMYSWKTQNKDSSSSKLVYQTSLVL